LVRALQHVNINFFKNVKKNMKSIENVLSVLGLVPLPELSMTTRLKLLGSGKAKDPRLFSVVWLPDPKQWGLALLLDP
jgi:hypothetical protein